MFDLQNWRVSVDQCHAKHIGPPPPLQQRIKYAEAHQISDRVSGRVWFVLGGLLRGVWRSVRRDRQ